MKEKIWTIEDINDSFDAIEIEMSNVLENIDTVIDKEMVEEIMCIITEVMNLKDQVNLKLKYPYKDK